MKHSIHTLGHMQSGQASVEFALVLLFIIIPVMAVLVEGALLLYTQGALTNVAREAARSGSIYQTHTPSLANQPVEEYVAAVDAERANFIHQQITRTLSPLVTPSTCVTSITYAPDPPALGNPYREMDSMSVRVICPHGLLFGLIGARNISLTSESRMRIEPGGVAPQPPAP